MGLGPFGAVGRTFAASDQDFAEFFEPVQGARVFDFQIAPGLFQCVGRRDYLAVAELSQFDQRGGAARRIVRGREQDVRIEKQAHRARASGS